MNRAMRIKIDNCTPEEVVFLSNAALNGREAVFRFKAKVLEVDYSVAAGEDYSDVFVKLHCTEGIKVEIDRNEKEK